MPAPPRTTRRALPPGCQAKRSEVQNWSEKRHSFASDALALYNPLTTRTGLKNSSNFEDCRMRVSIQEVEVGPFLVDLTTGRLLRDGIEAGLRPQACRAFKTLIQNRGHYVDYEHMIAEAWDGTIVSRHTFDVTVGEVKKILQEFGCWITHRPKVGYRLEAPKSEELIRRGWHFHNQRTREGLEKALTAFEQAAREDGTDFRAYDGLAATYLTMGTYGMR